jgi:hypothetical protein
MATRNPGNKIMSNTNTGGPAFPVTIENGLSAGGDRGMTLRDYFAAKAMQAIVSNDATFSTKYVGLAAKDAYVYADAMLKARTE